MVRLTPEPNRANVESTGSPFTAFRKPILWMGFLVFGQLRSKEDTTETARQSPGRFLI